MVDDQLLELLEQCEEAVAQGATVDFLQVAAGDAELAKRLEKQVANLQRMAWLNCEKPVPVQLHLPSAQTLQNALLLPDELDLATFQANLTKAELPDPAALAAILKTHEVKNAYQLANLLLESDLLTRFQLRAISRGRTRGLRLGRYVILDKIGEGGMGQVYKARHTRLDREVALKVLPRDAMNKANGVQRFYQEVQVAAKMRHPNIVTAYDADEAEGLHFLVMEYVEGRDLNTIVHRTGPLSPAKAVDYVIQAAHGLQYAHSVGLIHRDIKPANLLLNQAGVVKILDMGIARMQSDSASTGLTQSGAIMGTIDYMAPEQAIDAKTVTPQADIYSLGCSLYYLLTGRPPYGGETLMAKLLGHRDKSPPRLTAVRSDVPPALEEIYLKCLAKSPTDRFADAADLIAELEKVAPRLSDTTAALEYAPIESAADSSTSDIFPTLGEPSLETKNPIATKRRNASPSPRSAAIYGGAFAISAFLCGLLYFGVSSLKSPATLSGTVSVEVDHQDFVDHLRGKSLKLVNMQTNYPTTIELLNTLETTSLPPGSYKIALDADSKLRTDVSELTIADGDTAKINVSWEKVEQVAAATPVTPVPSTVVTPPKNKPTNPVASTPTASIPYVPAPPPPPPPTTSMPVTSRPGVAATVRNAPVAGSNRNSSPPLAYDSIANGQWVSLLNDQPEFDQLIGARQKPLSATEQASFSDGILTIRNLPLFFPEVTTKNFLYRGRLKYELGQKLALKFETASQSYGVWWDSGGTEIGLGKIQSNGVLKSLKTETLPASPPEFFELAVAGIDRTLIVYVEGKEQFRVTTDSDMEAPLTVGIGTSPNTKGAFKELQWMAVADDAVAPPLPPEKTPDYLAAKHILSIGGAVAVDGGRYISSEARLIPPPFVVSHVFLTSQTNAVDDDLALFAECKDVEWINLFLCKNLTGQCLSYFANCPNVKIVNLNRSVNMGDGLEQIAKWEQLEALRLDEVKFSLRDLLPLADRKFKVLSLRSTIVNDAWLRNVTNVENLEYLDLGYTSVTNRGLVSFKACKGIKELSLARTGVNDVGFSYFQDCVGMEKLNLTETAVSDASVDTILSFHSLTKLEITRTQITPGNVQRIHQALPNCEIVWDGGTIKPGK